MPSIALGQFISLAAQHGHEPDALRYRSARGLCLPLGGADWLTTNFGKPDLCLRDSTFLYADDISKYQPRQLPYA
jgi:hypothetical protein